MVINQVFSADTGAPGRARTLLDELDLPAVVHRDAALLLSELVTNAVLHADTPDSIPVHVALSLDQAQLRVEISDGGETGPLVPLPPDPQRVGGLGLMLVNQLASRWGQNSQLGTCVWFEIDFGQSVPADLAPSPTYLLAAWAALPLLPASMLSVTSRDPRPGRAPLRNFAPATA